MRIVLVMMMMMTMSSMADEVKGDVAFPETWTVFLAEDREPPAPTTKEEVPLARQRTKDAMAMELPTEALTRIPEQLSLLDKTFTPHRLASTASQLDLRPQLGSAAVEPGDLPLPDYYAWGQLALVYLPLESETAQTVTLGLGADVYLKAWLNGDAVFDNHEAESFPYPPAIDDYQIDVDLEAGRNLLVVAFISGKGSTQLALGGPRELRAGTPNSILTDPLVRGEPRWNNPDLQVPPGDKDAVTIGSRRELFVDDFLVDGMRGEIERRLHHPEHRNIIMELDQPWDGNASAYLTVLEADGKVRLYYNARPTGPQSSAVLISDDGIHFTRPVIGQHEIDGSTENNIVFRGGASGHNFTPFLDTNPDAKPEERFKAIAYHPNGEGLTVFASPDGIAWTQLVEDRVITKGGFDSQNLAFWDPNLKRYVDYHRGSAGSGRMAGLRGIMRATSENYIDWTEPELVTYSDRRREHMYTNSIRPYPRAPHLYIGTPSRYVTHRTKVPDHHVSGINDVVLMSSRDGLVFDRWEEGWVRPGAESNNWTDRNTYPSWHMVQTAPDELSLYWTEHYRHPTLRIRRGTIRVDGFVSLQGGVGVGEMLSRPLIFDGQTLEVNYASSAIGSIRFELCRPDGTPHPGFSLADSEVLFGNEIAHTVRWRGGSDVSALAGQPVRLRVRLQDADLYSLRFVP